MLKKSAEKSTTQIKSQESKLLPLYICPNYGKNIKSRMAVNNWASAIWSYKGLYSWDKTGKYDIMLNQFEAGLKSFSPTKNSITTIKTSSYQPILAHEYSCMHKKEKQRAWFYNLVTYQLHYLAHYRLTDAGQNQNNAKKIKEQKIKGLLNLTDTTRKIKGLKNKC